jgi:hypothetical protein
VDNVKSLLNMSIKWEANHVKRSANEVAHHLAKLALHLSEEQVWHGECPSCIHEIVLAQRL